MLVVRLCCQIELFKISGALVCALCLPVVTSAEKKTFLQNEPLRTQWEVVENKQADRFSVRLTWYHMNMFYRVTST